MPPKSRPAAAASAASNAASNAPKSFFATNKKTSILILLLIVYIIGLFWKPFTFNDDYDDFDSIIGQDASSAAALSLQMRQLQNQVDQLNANNLNIESLSANQRQLLMDSIIDSMSFKIIKDLPTSPSYPSATIVSSANPMVLPDCVDALSTICFAKFGENSLLFSPKSNIPSWRSTKWDLWNFSKSKPMLEAILSTRIQSFIAPENNKNDNNNNNNNDNDNNNNRRNSSVSSRSLAIQPVALFLTNRVFDGPSNYQISDLPVFQKSSEVIEYIPFSSYLDGLRHVSKRQIYSTSFETFCASVGVCNDTNWRALRIGDRDVLRTESDLREEFGDASIKLSTVSPILTFLPEDAALQARVSEYHTVRVQLRGVTRYTIFPTEELQHMHLFPYVHEAASQSQINFYDQESLQIDTQSFLKVKKHYVVELHPNDVLYIPPFYMVHSESPVSNHLPTDDDAAASSSSSDGDSDVGGNDSRNDNYVDRNPMLSIILDVISPSIEQILLSKAIQVDMPFNRTLVTSMAESERIIASQMYLMHVLSRIPGLLSPEMLSRRLYVKRYSLLYPENSHFIQNGDNEFDCYRSDDDNDLVRKVISMINIDLVTKAAKKVTELANNKRIDKKIRYIFVDNFIENVARWAMGSAERSVFFIRSCLYFDKYLEIIEEVPGDPVMKIGSASPKTDL